MSSMLEPYLIYGEHEDVSTPSSLATSCIRYKGLIHIGLRDMGSTTVRVRCGQTIHGCWRDVYDLREVVVTCLGCLSRT